MLNIVILCMFRLECGFGYVDVNVVWMNYVDVNVVYEYYESVWILYCQCFEFSVVELVYPVCIKNSNSRLIYNG
jgi:hypothetical protein